VCRSRPLSHSVLTHLVVVLSPADDAPAHRYSQSFIVKCRYMLIYMYIVKNHVNLAHMGWVMSWTNDLQHLFIRLYIYIYIYIYINLYSQRNGSNTKNTAMQA